MQNCLLVFMQDTLKWVFFVRNNIYNKYLNIIILQLTNFLANQLKCKEQIFTNTSANDSNHKVSSSCKEM